MSVEVIEKPTDTRKRPSFIVDLALPIVLQDGELQKKEFFKLQSVLGISHGLCILREMDVTDGLMVRHKVVFLQQCRRKNFGQIHWQFFESIGHQFVDEFGGDFRTIQAVGRVIDRLHAQQRTIDDLCQLLHLGMSDGKIVSERLGLAKHLIVDIDLVHRLQMFRHTEPYQLHIACAVRETGHQSPFGAFALLGNTDDASTQLDVLHPFRQIADAVNFCPIFVAEGIGVQQVANGANAQLCVEQFCTIGADAFEVGDVLIEIRSHDGHIVSPSKNSYLWKMQVKRSKGITQR